MTLVIVAVGVIGGLILLVVALRVFVLLTAGPAAQRRRKARRGGEVFFEDCHSPEGLRFNHFNRALPASPRCRLCFAPFGGLGPILGIRPSRKNPKFCNACFERAPMGGQEMDIGVLFADVRGFTGLSEQHSPHEIARLLNRFYDVATDALTERDAIIDKMMGDEVMALFLPIIPTLGEQTPSVLMDSAMALLRGVGYGSEEGPWLPLGIGVHYGPAFVGNVGSGEVKDFTAIGDTVNTTARLQAVAGLGEIVASDTVYCEVAERYPNAVEAQLALRGKVDHVLAHRIVIGAPGPTEAVL